MEPGEVDQVASTSMSDGSPLRRILTLPWMILYGLGSTVGAGIYVLTGAVAARAGMQTPIAFLIAAALALLTALSFAELSARFPRAGGALVYVREGLGLAWLSVAIGVLTAFAGMVSAATVSLGFVGYFAEIWTLPILVVLPIVVGGVGAIAGWGVRESVVFAGVITLIEVGGLLAILIYGSVYLMESTVPSPSLDSIAFDRSNWIAVVGSSVLCFYAFLGFEDMVNVAEEVKDVRRTLPRAILWTLALSTLLYVSVTTVAVFVVPPEELAGADAPLSLVFERSGGSAQFLALIALAAMLNGALVQIVMASRILFSLSREGPLPNWLGRVHPRTRTPLAATLLVTCVIGLMAATFPIASLAATTASIALGVFSLVNLSLLVLLLRERDPSRRALNRLPLWVPAGAALASLGFLLLELFRIFGSTLGLAD